MGRTRSRHRSNHGPSGPSPTVRWARNEPALRTGDRYERGGNCAVASDELIKRADLVLDELLADRTHEADALCQAAVIRDFPGEAKGTNLLRDGQARHP